MGGSRTGSRPQRQSKNAVSYRESDDDDFLPNAKQSAEVSGRKNSLRNSKEEIEIAKGRRSLTLKKPSRSQERSPPRESLDATKDASYYSSERPKVEQIVHIDEEVLKLQRESSAFQYLLDVASEARANGESEAAPVEYRDEEMTTGLPETRIEQDAITSSDVLEGELLKVVGIKEDREQEDQNSRKLKNVQANSGPDKVLSDVLKFDGVDNDDNGNKSSVDEEEEEADEEEDGSWDESSDASDHENKCNTKSRHNYSAAAKQHNAKQHNKVPKVSEDQVKNPKKTYRKSGLAAAPASPVKNAQQLLPKKRLALWVGRQTCSSPGGTPLNVQAPSIAHRRVVGLSRRHRPPPLHPYLVGSEM